MTKEQKWYEILKPKTRTERIFLGSTIGVFVFSIILLLSAWLIPEYALKQTPSPITYDDFCQNEGYDFPEVFQDGFFCRMNSDHCLVECKNKNLTFDGNRTQFILCLNDCFESTNFTSKLFTREDLRKSSPEIFCKKQTYESSDFENMTRYHCSASYESINIDGSQQYSLKGWDTLTEKDCKDIIKENSYYYSEEDRKTYYQNVTEYEIISYNITIPIIKSYTTGRWNKPFSTKYILFVFLVKLECLKGIENETLSCGMTKCDPINQECLKEELDECYTKNSDTFALNQETQSWGRV